MSGSTHGGSYGSRGEQGYGSGGGYGQGRYGSQGDGDRMRGGHHGRGPKNYTRSDDRIKEDLSERLYEDDMVDASEITIEVKDGVVKLSGSVDERWLKHRIEDMAEACSGVKDVENQLRVASSGNRSGSASTSGTASGKSGAGASGTGSGLGSGTSGTGSRTS
jgi:osmotically-inducible protein OsmY